MPRFDYPLNLPPCNTLRLGKNGCVLGSNDKLIPWVPFGLRNEVPFFEQEVIVLNVVPNGSSAGIEAEGQQSR